jgi:hypothetical protein
MREELKKLNRSHLHQGFAEGYEAAIVAYENDNLGNGISNNPYEQGTIKYEGFYEAFNDIKLTILMNNNYCSTCWRPINE